MGLFENAVNTAKSAAKNVGKKAEEVLDLSRNKLNIAELENKLMTVMLPLGCCITIIWKMARPIPGESRSWCMRSTRQMPQSKI